MSFIEDGWIMVKEKALKKKEKAKEKLMDILQKVQYSFTTVVIGDNVSSIENLLNKIPYIAIIQREIPFLSNIDYELGRLRKIMKTAPLTPSEFKNLEKLSKEVIKYFDIEKPYPDSAESRSPPPSPRPLKNWKKTPIILSMVEEKERSVKGGLVISSIGGKIEFSKVYHEVKLEKCRMCKGKNFSFVDDQKEMIYCNKCGQRYQVLEPDSKKVWTFK